ncbi:MAG: hypothetical protein R3C11_22740 [Planctomycetaceae bacterium]
MLITFPEASMTAYSWIGKVGEGTIAVSPGPIRARHMWLKPSLTRYSDNFIGRVKTDTIFLPVAFGDLFTQVCDSIREE